MNVYDFVFQYESHHQMTSQRSSDVVPVPHTDSGPAPVYDRIQNSQYEDIVHARYNF